LALDGAALLTMIIGGASNSSPVGGLGVAIYGLGPPIVHATKGRWGTAAGDLLLRVSAPIMVGLLGAGIETAVTPPCSGEDWCFRGLTGFLIGGATGYLAAVVIDASVLARDTGPSKPAPAAARSTVTWAPVIGVTRQGASMGIGGAF
jgi:hypothetical protein